MQREVLIFLIVGSSAVLTDFATYRLVALSGGTVDFSKAIGFMCGTAFAYFANRFWTFGHSQFAQGSGWRFVMLYSVTLVVNVQLNALVLSAFDSRATMPLAFLIATAVSASLNFLGMKFLVFRPTHFPETA